VNDASGGLLPEDFSVVVFDEAHRAVGDYAYVGFAAWLREHCPHALVLGLTASPGHEIGHIEEVRRNLGIIQVLVRTREDPDVAPYVALMEVRWIEVEASEVIAKSSALLTKSLHGRFNKLRRYGLLRNRKNTQVRMADLGQVGAQLAARMAKEGRKPVLFQAFRQLSLARMAMHAANTVQREGVDAFRRFMAPKLGPDRKRIDASFVNDPDVARAVEITAKWKGISHPKLVPLLALLKERALPGRKALVFAELRDTVDFIVTLLRAEGLVAERFTGQGTRDGRKGMTQKQQREALQRFSASQIPILVATSIAEEGLDIPQVDLVVFYEPVASDIRLIQRSGRTARDAPGEVVILTTDRSLDEKYLWSGLKREKRMKRLVRKLAAAGVERLTQTDPPPPPPPERRRGQARLDHFRGSL
jgi:Fanconi anemia group M protein